MKPTQLNGYLAAGILIKYFLDGAEKRAPSSRARLNRNSAAYRQGLYDGLLIAHCQMALGEFPNNNRAQIEQTLKPKK